MGNDVVIQSTNVGNWDAARHNRFRRGRVEVSLFLRVRIELKLEMERLFDGGDAATDVHKHVRGSTDNLQIVLLSKAFDSRDGQRCWSELLLKLLWRQKFMECGTLGVIKTIEGSVEIGAGL